jgi:hypothetical protein
LKLEDRLTGAVLALNSKIVLSKGQSAFRAPTVNHYPLAGIAVERTLLRL